jgi:hypothetical protein
MALVLTVAVGDLVDIADNWIALASIDSATSVTLISCEGKKVSISSDRETEVFSDVWLRLGPGRGRLKRKLLVEAPKALTVRRRPKPTC